MLGFSADVFLGMFDDRDYVQQRELLSKLPGRNIEPPFFLPFFFRRFFANLLSPSALFKASSAVRTMPVCLALASMAFRQSPACRTRLSGPAPSQMGASAEA
ncbi:hypothetical protein M2D63_017400 [Pseudomonas sp. BJa5]|uniref:hypothetical protein n=1 Tax=Pseudomonas sp. BJa5 TaxID=2936270 RepID=UPI002566524E|nr:hypothetical protein [Pseudomonas sp. BGr12]